MLHDEPAKYASDTLVLHRIFSAYRSLRFTHQVDYATYKLQRHTDKPLRILKWPVALLQMRTEAVASFCLITSLVFSLIIVVGHATEIDVTKTLFWQAGIITLLIVNMAARTVQDGLATSEELERYNDYAGKTRYLMQRFDDSSEPFEKLALMAEMERAALEELTSFLRAHSNARFIV